jgi:hypothetical protein
VPGTTLSIDRNRLGQFRTSYRFLGYERVLNGGSMPDDLYGDDHPEPVDALYAETFAWMNDCLHAGRR